MTRGERNAGGSGLRTSGGPPDPVEAIARAVLYEGYSLWPYRRSALKNRRRWTFGGLYPRGFCEEAGESDAWRLACRCLVEGPPGAALGIELRCLQVVRRQAYEGTGAAAEPVGELRSGDALHLTWDEASERRLAVAPAALGELAAAPRRHELELPAGRTEDPLPGPLPGPGSGLDARLERAPGAAPSIGCFRRTWERLETRLELSAEPLAAGLWRVAVTVENTSPWRGAAREEAQRRSPVSTHLVLRVDGGAFVSPADPPPGLAREAAACRSDGLWPVLVGEPGSRSTLLASPILLEDYPRVAPESPGDLFDGVEIEQLLTLNILALTDEEKREMAASDDRTREILARTEALTRDQLARLHGTFREPRGTEP